MRVLLFAYEYPPLGGGVANAVFHLLETWKDDPEMEIHCVTSSLDNTWERRKLARNITLHFVPIGNRSPSDYHQQRLSHMLRYVFGSVFVGLRLRFSVRPEKTLAFGYPGPIASWLLSWTGVPFVVALRGVDVPGYNPRFSWGYRVHQVVARVLWSRASGMVANSQWLADLARKTWPKAQIDVIPNGVDTELFKPVPESQKFSAFTVTAGGTVMGKKKQLDVLMRGFAEFVRQQNLSSKQAQLLLIGDGDERENLQELAQELDLESYVRFTGSKDKAWIAKNLSRCHVFCLPSVAEGMSNAALEAMACGLPLILSDVGAAREMVREGEGLVLSNVSQSSISLGITKIYNRRYENKKSIKNDLKTWNEVSQTYSQQFFECKNSRIFVIDHMKSGGAQVLLSEVKKERNTYVYQLKGRENNFFLNLPKILLLSTKQNVFLYFNLNVALTIGFFYKCVVPRSKVIFYDHGSLLSQSNAWVEFIRRRSLTVYDKILVLSTHQKRKITDHYHIASKKISLIHNFISEKVAQDLLDIGKYDKSTPGFGFVGRANIVKGLDRFLMLAQKYSAFGEFHIFTDSFMQQKIDVLKIHSSVSDKKQIYQNVSFVVVPSRRESFSLVFLEALVAGRVVLAADIPTLRELYDDFSEAIVWVNFDKKFPPDVIEQLLKKRPLKYSERLLLSKKYSYESFKKRLASIEAELHKI